MSEPLRIVCPGWGLPPTVGASQHTVTLDGKDIEDGQAVFIIEVPSQKMTIIGLAFESARIAVGHPQLPCPICEPEKR